jgi:hypothetical protein
LLDRLEPFELLLRQQLGEDVLFGLLSKQPIGLVALERSDTFDGLCCDTLFSMLQIRLQRKSSQLSTDWEMTNG